MRFNNPDRLPYPTEANDMPILAWSTLSRCSALFPQIVQRAAQGGIANVSTYCIDTSNLDLVARRAKGVSDPEEVQAAFQRDFTPKATRYFVVDGSRGDRRIHAGLTQSKQGEWYPLYVTRSYKPCEDAPGQWSYGLEGVEAARVIRYPRDDIRDSFHITYTKGQPALTQLLYQRKGGDQPSDYALRATHNPATMQAVYSHYLPEPTTEGWREMVKTSPYGLFYLQTCQALGNLSWLAGEDPAQPFGPQGSPYDIYQPHD